MQHESYTRTPPSRKVGFPPLRRAGQVVHLHGYLSATVWHGGLRLQDRLFGETRTGWYPRIAPPRRVILDGDGWISTAALQWLHDVGAGLLVLGRDDELVATGSRGALDAKLVRRQVRAATDPLGLRISKFLLGLKLERQARVLEGAGVPRAELLTAARRLAGAPSLDVAREIESQAAARYWEALAPTPLRFARRDLSLVPPHWTTAGPHTSPLTASPRAAVTPFHAMVNYLSRIGEAQCRTALLNRGISIELGIIHLDTPYRASFALDALDAIRPEIEAWLLDFARGRVFAKADFCESLRGSVTISYDLRSILATTALRWRAEADPVVSRLARMLGAPERTKQRRPARSSLLPHACLECGSLLEGKPRDRLYCDECLPVRRLRTAADIGGIGRETLARLRAAGRDPAHGGAAGRERGTGVAQANTARAHWQGWNGQAVSPEELRAALARLRSVPLGRIAKALQVSPGYASFIRRGLRTPHPRHWRALAALAKGR